MVDRPEDYRNDIEFIQAKVSKQFPIYRTEVEFDIVNIYVRISRGDDFEERFDELRQELVPLNFIPFLREEKGEYIISVKKNPARTYRTVKTNIIMLIVTLCTTLIAGMWWWSSYTATEPFFSLYNLGNGALFFTIPLMTILGIHEMGHYFMARHHNIRASLPFFLPFAPPLGTIGAFISIRDPIPNRKSLLDLGVSGPICGFLVAIPVAILGIYLGGVMDRALPLGMEGTVWIINYPLIFLALDYILPFGGGATMHPTAFAGWVGFLVTGLNLLPAGQLDGGHVVRSLFGERAKYASYVAAGFLVVAGIWFYPGWLFFAIFLLFFVGLKHPPPLNELGKLDPKRKMVGVLVIILLFSCFHPIPIEEETFRYDFDIELSEPALQTVALNESAVYTFKLTNTGTPNADTYNVSFHMRNHTWHGSLYIQRMENNATIWAPLDGNWTSVSLDVGENSSFRLEIAPSAEADLRNDVSFKVRSNATGREKTEELVIELDHSFSVDTLERYSIVEDGEAEFSVFIYNRGRNDTYEISAIEVSNESWNVYFLYNDTSQQNLSLHVPSGGMINFTAILSSDTFTRGMRLYIDGENVPTRSDAEFVIATIRIRSTATDDHEDIEILGLQIGE